MKKVLMAVAAMMSFSAFATSYNLGTLVPGENYLASSELSTVQVRSGTFSDQFSFVVSQPSFLSISAGVLNFGKWHIQENSFIFTLMPTGSIGHANEYLTAFATPGNYWLQVVGTTFNDKMGRYDGSITAFPAVPEPTSGLMLLAGLGMIGAVARKKMKH